MTCRTRNPTPNTRYMDNHAMNIAYTHPVKKGIILQN